MKTRYVLLFSVLVVLYSCKDTSKNTIDIDYSSEYKHKEGLEVIQFHMEHRCKTCVAIETITQKAIAPYQDLPFRLVNIEIEENDAMARKFRAAGTALFLHDPATGKKLDLTDFAFMNAFDEAKFIAGLQKEIDQF